MSKSGQLRIGDKRAYDRWRIISYNKHEQKTHEIESEGGDLDSMR